MLVLEFESMVIIGYKLLTLCFLCIYIYVKGTACNLDDKVKSQYDVNMM